MQRMSKLVLDASAVLALLNQEPGGDKVEGYLADAILSAVNASEILAVLEDAGMPLVEAEIVLFGLVKEIVVFDREQAVCAAQFRKLSKSYVLSLGDRACLALAKTKNIPVMTADKIWKKVPHQLEVMLIR